MSWPGVRLVSGGVRVFNGIAHWSVHLFSTVTACKVGLKFDNQYVICFMLYIYLFKFFISVNVCAVTWCNVDSLLIIYIWSVMIYLYFLLQTMTIYLLSLVVVGALFFPPFTSAQIPTVCSDAESLENLRCCPTTTDGMCGGDSGRGQCVQVDVDGYSTESSDVRGNWPHYYREVCVCVRERERGT